MKRWGREEDQVSSAFSLNVSEKTSAAIQSPSWSNRNGGRSFSLSFSRLERGGGIFFSFQMKFSIERKKEKKVPRKNTEKRNSVLAEVAHFHFDRSNPDVGYYSIEKSHESPLEPLLKKKSTTVVIATNKGEYHHIREHSLYTSADL